MQKNAIGYNWWIHRKTRDMHIWSLHKKEDIDKIERIQRSLKAKITGLEKWILMKDWKH